MPFDNRRARKLTDRGPGHVNFRPRCEGLEAKILLTIDLGGTGAGANPTIAFAPFGMDFGATTVPNNATTPIPSQGAGTSVADLGDVNGDNFEDFAIAAPNASSSSGSYVSVIFGSNKAGTPPSVQNWIGTTSTTPLVYTYLTNDRVGDLNQLGATAQTNPITGLPLDFPFAGVNIYSASLNLLAGVDSLAGVNIGGRQGLLIGAPGANGGTGAAYLIYGNFNAYSGMNINLDTPAAYPLLNFVTFTTTGTGSRLGTSVAGGVNILGDGSADVILGAPAASVGPQVNSGAVYVISTGLISGLGQNGTFDVTTAGQTGNSSMVFAGVNSGDQAGASVADAGSVNGVTNVDDLLIGAPEGSSSAGSAYLIYGGAALPALATTTNGVRFINLARVGVGTTGAAIVPGANFTGPAGNDQTGFAVSSAGDFNNDGFSDIQIGAPGFDTSTAVQNNGAVYMFYGAASTSGSFLTGTINLGNIPTTLQSVTLIGANGGDLAGSSLAPVGIINSGQPNEILIGAPGFKSGQGTAYLIPGQTGLSGVFSLGNAESNPLSGVQFVFTTSSSTAANLFGSSVSGRLQTTTNTADLDNKGDFIIGAPGYDLTQGTRPGAGGAQIVQGGLITVPIPTGIQTTIGVGQPFGPFNINATTPANLQIWVFGSTSSTPNFTPVTDINPTTIFVNGVAFPNATLTPDPNTADFVNGIQPAIITISPRASLGLSNGSQTITITGQMVDTSPLFPLKWTGSAQVNVSGGAVTPVVSGAAGVPRGPNLQTNFIPPFGANQYTPSLTTLSAFSYQPIPVSVALAQFLPPQGFRQRIYTFNHPGKTVGPFLTNRGQHTGRGGKAQGVTTLSSKVFDRSRFHPQRNYDFTHKAPKAGILKGVIPTQLGREHFGDNLIV
jgi:FG-GAP repeat